MVVVVVVRAVAGRNREGWNGRERAGTGTVGEVREGKTK